MPIEIRELVIRAVVRPGPSGPSVEVAPTRAEPEPAPGEALVARCVREVLRELRRSLAR